MDYIIKVLLLIIYSISIYIFWPIFIDSNNIIIYISSFIMIFIFIIVILITLVNILINKI